MVMVQLFICCCDVSLRFLHNPFWSDSVSYAAAADSNVDECDVNTDESHFTALIKVAQIKHKISILNSVK